MFGLAKKQPMLPHPPALRLVKDERLTEYLVTAKEIGFHPPDLVRLQLLDVLREADIAVYGNTEVYAYLDRLAVSSKQNWDWYPLRETDEPSPRVEGHKAPSPLRGTCGDFMEVRYTRLVPAAELKKVALIEKKLPGHLLRFFVSDYKVKEPDPFICAWMSGMTPVVFGVWDEPGFGG